ncbi:MAG: efflux RND transporter periplasmic adaptor subunit [Shewanella sp.]|nr:efflux RND transporter periplasmic adaptor subunit [Shewanella sp.]MCF1430512.1 efflux RND transporter periplasmic adaptor subunit [Shewanella sp.]MCF1439820.1 efflux RND transporter periplasmic adaptor subunit [Shewanella sp.]MCF1457423.1 efflux RND transporter periplasmic adaptor subunit [Shewanella sp.]
MSKRRVKQASYWAMLGLIMGLGACSDGHRNDVLTMAVDSASFEVTIPAQGELEASQSTSVSVPTRLRGPQSLAWLIDNFRKVKAGDVVARLDPSRESYNLELERFAFDKLGLDRKIQTQKDETADRQLKLDADVNVEELALARRFFSDDERVYTKIDIIDQMRNQSYLEARQDYLGWGLEQHDSQAQAEQSLLALKQKSHQSKMNRYENNLAYMEIKAPHDGIFVYSTGWSGEEPAVGDMVWSGMVLGILPDTSTMQARLYVLESEAAGLAVGKRAQVRLDAYPERVFYGTVSQVDALAKPREKNSPVNYFELVVTLDKTVPELMKPGRQVTAVIEILKLDDVITVPNQALFQKEGKYWVYVAQGRDYRRQQVELGERSLNRTVITRGLSKGDIVALTKPGEAR